MHDEHEQVKLASSSSSSSISHNTSIMSGIEEGELASSSNKPPLRQGTHEFITPKRTAALDRCKISNRNAMHIVMAITEALGHNPKSLILNRTSL